MIFFSKKAEKIVKKAEKIVQLNLQKTLRIFFGFLKVSPLTTEYCPVDGC